MFQVSIIQPGHLGIPATSCLESLDNVLNGNSNGIVIEKWSEMNCNKIQFKQLQDFNLKNVNPSVKQSSVRLSCSKPPAAWNQPLINCSTFSDEIFRLFVSTNPSDIDTNRVIHSSDDYFLKNFSTKFYGLITYSSY